ncbi:beta-eliminating lyase-related protein [Streptomyces sp. NBC_00237]|uniref:threonine aldolase family protein n=1 Tax=Streptomyces sp. NBC_00237 TaxID=2975687 RepID=UPI002251907F|nr:beta-eliminating lyase-related protein [Streptomyces sp. NBC_00237]MCX5207414.1 beta-eliminating lyase-related protein [Streptomyces sp. NBC_00237]
MSDDSSGSGSPTPSLAPSTDPGPGPSPSPSPDQRRRDAWRGAKKVLARVPVEHRIGDSLAALAADAGAVYDLDAYVDLYGDGVVGELERRTARALGKEAAAFFPTGTMAQQVALRCWAGRTGNSTVALHPRAHPEQHERNALSEVSGLRTVHPTGEPRLPTAEEVRDFEEPFGTLMLELPLREAGFVLPSWEELEEVVEAARERDAVVHFDGARLWECTEHFGRPLEEIAALADTVYVSFYKSLGGMSGAALAGPATLIEEARTWRHRYGGDLFHQYPAALSALLGLARELPRLPEYVAHAKVVAEALGEGLREAGVPWFRVNPEVPHTHQFQVWLPYAADVTTDAAVRQAEETGVALFHRWFPCPEGPPGISVTEVTVAAQGLEWTARDVRSALAAFVGRIA